MAEIQSNNRFGFIACDETGARPGGSLIMIPY